MTTLITPQEQTDHNPLRRFVSRAWTFNPILTLAGLVNLALIPLFAAAALLDPRVITGMPAWIKPLKFAMSISLYALTFVWLLTFVQGRARWVRWVGSIVGVGLLVEMGLIAMQVVRGTTSHFNVSTPFDTAVFSIMGAMITAVAVLNLVVAIWLLRQRMADPVNAWSLRFALLVSFVGMVVAFLMTSPTAAQLAAAEAGQPLTVAGAHSVGVADGGAGLPFLGWSTDGGDLRVPHFFGLHAMQVLLLVGFLLTRRRMEQRWTVKQRTALVWVAGLGYLGLVGLLTWQALRGQPVIAPDVLTLTALAVLVGAVGLATAVILRLAPRTI